MSLTYLFVPVQKISIGFKNDKKSTPIASVILFFDLKL